MRDRFQEQLMLLNKELVEMGALCEEAIRYAVNMLTEKNTQLKEKAIDAEKQIDRMERDIEALCMRLLMHQQPVATDFRMVTAALKMISDLERIGDHAEDIAEIAEYVSAVDLKSKIHISEIAQAAVQMVITSVNSYVQKNTDLAKAVIAADDKVDEYFKKVKRELIKAVRSGNDNAEVLLDLLMIAKYFERIGDHAENVAEWVIYAITGVHKVT